MQSELAWKSHTISRLRQEKEKAVQSLEELEERYRPFHDQIDGLEGLNLLLKSQTSLAQSEAQKLSEQYARLLGHQNQKQKIQHVKKLKDENASLKQVSNAPAFVFRSCCDVL